MTRQEWCDDALYIHCAEKQVGRDCERREESNSEEVIYRHLGSAALELTAVMCFWRLISGGFQNKYWDGALWLGMGQDIKRHWKNARLEQSGAKRSWIRKGARGGFIRRAGWICP